MEQYSVTGMSSRHAAPVKGGERRAGRHSCSSACSPIRWAWEGTADASAIIAAVEAAGYGASLKGALAGRRPRA